MSRAGSSIPPPSPCPGGCGRAKSDAIDGETLLRTLLAFRRGEPRVCSMVHPPSVEEEDRRRITRERRTLLRERIEHTNRIKGLLMSQGVTGYDPLGKDRWARLESLETRDGHALPPRLKAEIGREIERLELLARQIRQVEAERDALAATVPEVAASPAALLLRLKGVGPESATLLWLEGLFRTFANRRQLAAYAGLAPTPWLSGRIRREQGISKAGNPRLRTAMIELAWLWLRHQPEVRLEPVVRRARPCRRRPEPPDDDRGPGAETSRRPLALPGPRPSAGRRGAEAELTAAVGPASMRIREV